jgi:hypothetical protein
MKKHHQVKNECYMPYKKVSLVIYGMLLLLFIGCVNTQKKDAEPAPIADNWEYLGEVLNEPGYDIWGSSPIRDEGGKIHLFSSRWPSSIKFSDGWRFESEIAHYISDKPEGPFTFKEVVLSPEKDVNGWKAAGFHNPNIRKVGDKYVLVFIANDGNPKHGPSQCIGMILADNINGPWESIPDDNTPLLSTPDEKEIWCFNSGCGVNNPSLLQHPDGRFLLYFKAMTGPRPEGRISMGVAISDSLEGPYIIQPKPITANQKIIEDGYAFVWRNQICLLTTDNHGILETGGGLLWTSNDGLSFNSEPLSGFHNFADFYLKGKIPASAKVRYGNKVKFERPQILLDSVGEPEYLYCPSGIALDGSDGTNCYLLRYKKQVDEK